MKIIKVKRFDSKTATESEWQLFHNLFAPIIKELYPYELDITVEDTKKKNSNFPDIWGEHQWVALNEKGTEFLGRIWFSFRKDEKNSAYIVIDVAKEHRKKGIAKLLLLEMLEFIEETGRSIFTVSTMSSAPDGEGFVKHLGMKLGQTCKLSRVDFKDVDIELMKKWSSGLNESEFEIGFWQNPYPENEIEAYAKMENDFWASAPLDDLETEDPWNITVEELRQRMKIFKEKKLDRPVVYVKHLETGEYAGYTDVVVDNSRPGKVCQFATGVLGKYRRKGMGRAIKAEMILKLMEFYPEAKYITTANSETNNSMLNINIEMGYKHYSTWNQWQIKLDELKSYLKGEKK